MFDLRSYWYTKTALANGKGGFAWAWGEPLREGVLPSRLGRAVPLLMQIAHKFIYLYLCSDTLAQPNFQSDPPKKPIFL
ncbi:MAG: hypothetical protein IJX98_04745 [Clostridia bacterium]|nr:hypothetical protein [Clostridia bacterium]